MPAAGGRYDEVLRAHRAETKHECSGRFRRSRSVGLRARRAQRAGRPKSLTSRPRLERLPLTSYQKVIFAIIATAWFFDSMDLGALTFVLGSIKQTFQLSTAEVGLLSSLSFLGMFVGAASAGLFGGPLRSSQGVSDQHDLLGARQPRLRPVIDSRHARRLASVAWLRHGHGISGRAIHGIGNHSGGTARPLHRLSRRLLAARLHRLGRF